MSERLEPEAANIHRRWASLDELQPADVIRCYPCSPGSPEGAPARTASSGWPCPAQADMCTASAGDPPGGLLAEGPLETLLPGSHRLAHTGERRTPAADEIWAAE